MDTTKSAPFQLLSHEDFAKLSRDQKIAYLSLAIEAVKENVPIIGFIRTPSEEARKE